MTDTILHDKELSNSSYSHVINAPIEKSISSCPSYGEIHGVYRQAQYKF
jgi:hypothetical protein